MQTIWDAPPQEPPQHLRTQLERGVHVWRIDLRRGDEGRLRADLDDAEREKADAFHFDRDRRSYIVAHAAQRRILAGYLDRDPRELQFRAGPYDKPYLADGGPEFNLSHSGDLALLAVAGLEVGVDVERERDFGDAHAMADIARSQFAPAEFEAWSALPESLRTRGFFLAWSRKEAFIKAIGLGLNQPLDEFEVELHPQREARFVRFAKPEFREDEWALRNLDPAPGYAGALALRMRDVQVRAFEYDDRD